MPLCGFCAHEDAEFRYRLGRVTVELCGTCGRDYERAQVLVAAEAGDLGSFVGAHLRDGLGREGARLAELLERLRKIVEQRRTADGSRAPAIDGMTRSLERAD